MLRAGLHYTPEQVLPHACEMRLLDEICAYGDDWLEAAVTIRADTQFGDAGGVPSWVGIEYMAQAIAAFAGIEQLQKNQPVKIGLLIGTRSYDAQVPRFTVGSRLTIRAKVVLRDETDLVVFDCGIEDGGRMLAQGQIKAYRPEDIRAFLSAAGE